MAGILQGIRVIDFGRFIAAPYCAMLLADFGADVIRVERREGGEDRFLGPVTESGEGGLFLNLNRNKRGMTLDFANPTSAEITRRLIKGADIVIVNLPIDVMKKINLDYDSLREIKPDIILVMASTFGPDGPYATRVGFDTVAQAMSGAVSLTGFPDSPPVRAMAAYCDFGTALHGAFGAMAALYEREKSGRGQVIDVSLLATAMTMITPLLAERVLTGIERRQQGNASYYSAPSDIYRAKDGWVLTQVIGNPMFRRWARVVGREDLIDDPRCKDDITRGNHYEFIAQVMNEWCARKTRDEAISELEKARIPCGPVYNLDEVLSDPQVKARGLLQELEYPTSRKLIPVSHPALRMSETPAQLRHRAPMLGEHTNDVLRELGFTAEEIEAFRTAGAV